jgi:hypothetical protein
MYSAQIKHYLAAGIRGKEIRRRVGVNQAGVGVEEHLSRGNNLSLPVE